MGKPNEMTERRDVPLPIVLVGLPGTGKSKVGRRLAVYLGVDHVDTDALIEATAEKTVSEIFAEQGEPHFRELELQAVRSALETRGVISLGGGAVETAEVRELLGDVTVVHIRASLDELLARVGRNSRRPLLRDRPVLRLRELQQRRLPWYTEVADLEVFTSSEPVDRVLEQIVAGFPEQTIIPVGGDDPYSVAVGTGIVALGLAQIPSDVARVLLVRPETLSGLAGSLKEELRRRGQQVVDFVHPEGEQAKTLSVAEAAWNLAGEKQIGRRDLVVTLGGGVTTDLGGFIAATWLRGIRVIHFPTSLLAMVDAAVGGKTGINSPAGKNLIGAFYNPLFVGADVSFLQTLPPREYAAGLGEVIKCGFIADPEILELIRANPQIGDLEWATGAGRGVLQELITRSVAVKAEVVSSDFKESGLREILNYGHTLAHAIERSSDYSVRHGEAVAIGCVFAAEVASDLGLIDRDLVEAHRELFAAVGLPISHSGWWKIQLDLMYSDKKTRAEQLRFVVLNGLGDATTTPVTPDDLEKAAVRMGFEV